MIKKTITYKKVVFDAAGEATTVTRTEDFYFNLNRAEALEINLMEDLEKLSESTNPRAIIPVFKRIIHYAYGVKTSTGKFTKDPEETTDFLASDAYAELFLELLGEGEKGVAAFIDKVLDFKKESLKETTESLPAEAPVSNIPEGARLPQDYQKKQEIPKPIHVDAVVASGTEAEKGDVIAVFGRQDPAEKYRVPTTEDAAADPEYQAFLAQKADRGQAPNVSINEETTPQIIERDDEVVASPAFEQTSRRELRQG